ncbi:MAG TPA: alpha-amylase family glycosyl hydrolase [Opitutaceae bacterium]|jgi:maltose alpha-D-glucosyltransferase/alpha-amylase
MRPFFTPLLALVSVLFLCPARGGAAEPGPAWARGAVFYEIYPQTFRDSNGDGIGDLPGIVEKLDYVKSLGVSAIWLNPFYESSFRDAGYDVTDFYSVAKRYGTNADAKRLFAQAHRRGLHVIIDFVPGHTSIDHPWFKESAKGTKNRYSNWYVWTDRTWVSGIDRNQFTLIQGYSDRDGCYLANFFWHQPALNYGFDHPDPQQPWQLPVNHPDVRAMEAEMENVMRFWLNLGCDGFRVDMAGSLIKGDNDGACARYWRGVRARLQKDYPDLFLVSEWSSPIDSLNGGFNADFLHWIPEYNRLFQGDDRKGPWFADQGGGDITRFLGAYLKQYEATKDKGFISLPFANHDLPRISSNGRSRRDIECIYAFELTMPGTPFLYYGDEIGLRQLQGLPHTEGSYGTRAGARTPMQWDSSPNLGFSAASPEKLYRAVDSAPDAPTVEAAERDPLALIHLVRKLVALRRTEPALSASAAFKVLYAEKDQYPFAYLRSSGAKQIVVILNPRNSRVELPLAFARMPKQFALLAGSCTFGHSPAGATTAALEGESYAIVRADAE